MQFQFSKYHGTGNDFILIDGRTDGSEQSFSITEKQVAQLCDRRYGIGADGLIILVPHPNFDFEMINYNSDGSLSSFCGNGARTLIQFAKNLGINKLNYIFQASDGPHEARIEGSLIHLKMNDVTSVRTTTHGPFLNTGSPHLVCFSQELEKINLKTEGPRLRHHSDFAPSGTNVNFVEVSKNGNHKIRTFERGVEDETLSCGTGVIAAALTLRNRQPGSYEETFETKGGFLSVKFEQKSTESFQNIWLIGPAVKTFSGTY